MTSLPDGVQTGDEGPTALPATHAVQRAVAALASGGMVAVIDDADRENEADLVLAAGTVTAEQVAFVVRHTTGILCAPMPEGCVDELGLPQMVDDNTDAHETAFTVSVDMIGSAADRVRTFVALADPSTRPENLRRPATSFRSVRGRAGYSLARDTPRPLWICWTLPAEHPSD